jgi:hypothetical protein
MLASLFASEESLRELLLSPSVISISSSYEDSFHESLDWSSFPPLIGNGYHNECIRQSVKDLFDSSIEYYSSPSTAPVARDEPVATASASSPSLVKKQRGQLKQKKVSFCPLVEFRTFSLTIGTHPCCLGGMAIECDWSYSEPETINLELQEQTSQKRRQDELRMSIYQRVERLSSVSGLSPNELFQLEKKSLTDAQVSTIHHTGTPTVRRGLHRGLVGLSAC